MPAWITDMKAKRDNLAANLPILADHALALIEDRADCLRAIIVAIANDQQRTASYALVESYHGQVLPVDGKAIRAEGTILLLGRVNPGGASLTPLDPAPFARARWRYVGAMGMVRTPNAWVEFSLWDGRCMVGTDEGKTWREVAMPTAGGSADH
jgi:hypothetical protein